MTGPILQALLNPSESRVFRSTIIQSIVYPVVLLLLLTGIFLWQLETIGVTAQRVEHSNIVITQAALVLKQMVDMETGLRGYLLTGSDAFLQPYNEAQEMIDDTFAGLQALVTDNPAQTSRLEEIASDIANWRSFAGDVLDSYAPDRPVDVQTQLDGKQEMDLIRGQMAGFVDAEERLRGDRIQQTGTTTGIVIVTTVLGGLIAGGVLAIFIRRQLIRLSRSYEQILKLAREQADEILTRQEWLRGVLFSIGDAVIATDLKGNVAFINPVTEALTGWSAEDAAGKPLADVYQVTDQPETVLPAAGESRRLTARTGRVYAIDENATPIMTVHGEPLGTVVVFRDVTRRQMIEKERARLLENQTRYASMLRHSNEELEQFAYVASHDLQEPLRMVVSYLQLLENRYASTLTAEAREFIGYAVDGATRMKALITGLLQYARLDDVENIQETTALDNMLKQAQGNLALLITESGAAITSDPLPQIQADALQMMQLFQNLIENAIKFRSDRPLTIHIGAVQKGSEWEFSVRDNGIGIAPEFQKRLFRLFQRLHPRGSYSGTGIGLATCKKIVEQHHGRIWIESTEGSGATFYFTLPARQDSPPMMDT